MSLFYRWSIFVLISGFMIVFLLSGCAPKKTGVDHKLDQLEDRLTELEIKGPEPEVDPQNMERLIIIMKYGPAISYDQPTQKDAVVALGLLGDEDAVPALIEQFNTSADHNFKSYIANSLGWIGDKKAVPVLKKALKSKNVHLRKRAALALKKIKEKSSLTNGQKRILRTLPVTGFYPF